MAAAYSQAGPSGGVEVIDTIGPEGAPKVLVLYTGGTIGMQEGPDGTLVPLHLRELASHVPIIGPLPVRLTLAAFSTPIDSAAATPAHWLDIADAIVEHAADHAGIVVLHGTDTMAYTASALSFLLDGLDRPIVLTGAQRPVTSVRSDARQNLVTALEVAATAAPVVPEVAIFFGEVLLRGNRSSKVHADSYRAFASPNFPPLGTAGVALEVDGSLLRSRGVPPLRRAAGLCTDVASVRLHPGLDEASLDAVLARPGLRGLVVEAYGSGNGPTATWFTDRLRQASTDGAVVVVTTQCPAGGVLPGHYATGAALFATGAVSAGDMTFEAALTKLMVVLGRLGADEARLAMGRDLAGEMSVHIS